MADFLIQATVSNVVMSATLAIIAWIVQRRFRSAALANLLWCLVLIKMVTPPLLAIPVLEVPRISPLPITQQPISVPLTSALNERLPKRPDRTDHQNSVVLPTQTISSPVVSSTYASRIAFAGHLIWLTGSLVLLAVSSVRIIRFHWLLKANAVIDQRLTATLSSDIATQFSLQHCPKVLVTSASLAPFVWWMSGRAVIVVSARVLKELTERDLRLVLTHEIAHIKRRDHWFRWLEWVALVTFWWNPVVWWARQQLRISEEKACDELVLQQPTSEIDQYANSLLNVAELLATSAIRPPILATAINSGGSLEERLKTMMNGKASTVPTLLRATIVAVATCVLPLGLVYAQDLDAVERRLGGGVEAGELTLKQATLMLDTLQSATAQKHEHAKRKEQPSKELNEHRHSRMAEGIKAAVEAGKLVGKEANLDHQDIPQGMLDALAKRKELPSKKINAHRHSQMIEAIKAAVKAGKLSKEEAERKMQPALRNLFEAQEHEQRERAEQSRQGINAHRHGQMIEEINAAVKAGKLSKEEAERKMKLALRNLFEAQEHEQREREERSRQKINAHRHSQMIEKIKADVEAGKLTQEEAKRKLQPATPNLFEPQKQEQREREEKLRQKINAHRHSQMIEKIKADVEAGKLTQEEAKRKLQPAMRNLFEPKKQEQKKREEQSRQGINAHRHSQMIKEIIAAVESGKLSEEEAERKMQPALRNLFEAQEQKQREREEQLRQGINQHRHSQMIEEIKADVNFAELTENEANLKLQSIRQRMLEAHRGHVEREQKNHKELNPTQFIPKADAKTRQTKQTEQGQEAARRRTGEARAQMLHEHKVDTEKQRALQLIERAKAKADRDEAADQE